MATILIIDDLAANREFLVLLLREQGHRVLEAGNGREGLELVRAERPDLVVTDVLMPVMDGYEFVRQLRLDPDNRDIPVLFYTASYSEREARGRALASGIPCILRKAASPEEVLRIVGHVLAGTLDAATAADSCAATNETDCEHLRLLTDELSEKDEDLRSANARLRALLNIGLELASTSDPDRLLQHVCAAACDLFGATYVTLGIVDPRGRTVERVVTCGTDAGDWWRAGDPVSGILGTVVTERRTLRGDNPGGDPAELRLPGRHPKVQSFLAAPVASPAHVYGWFCLVGNEGREFSKGDEDLVTALSGQIGRIYEIESLSATVRMRAKELEREVLARERVESELRLERDQAQRYLDTAEVILLRLDIEGRILLVNRHACSILGWTPDELIGRDWIETCLPARIRAGCRTKLAGLLGGEPSVMENPVLTRSGEERLVEWRNTVLRDEQGKIIGSLSSGTDITERTSAARELQETEERMRFALAGANVGIWDMNYPTGLLRWSEILEAHYGMEPGTFDGTFEMFVSLVHPEDRRIVLHAIQESMYTGSDFAFQYRVIRPDGMVRWLAGAGRMHLSEQGEPLRAIGISMDITESRALEGQYQHAQKMEAIGRLAGGVAHDFNNLLAVILGYSRLLLADLSPEDPSRPDIAEIEKAGVSAARLTRQLLAFSRKEIIEPTLLDLNVVLAETRVMLERLIREDVKVVFELEPGLALVKADRGQVEQVVVNLAINARDAMPNGGTLTIETANVDLDEHYAKVHPSAQAGRYVALVVSDNGTGMSQQVQSRLFEPFFTTKAVGQGSGLGLATVHGIVTRGGGSIGVYSELGVGTSFKVYFPRADVADVVVAPVPEPPARRVATETVLLVEDAEGLRELTRRLLEAQGYTVLAAADADEALRLSSANESIDVLLTDVVMPGASGPELAARLLERKPDLEVVYMSGYTEDAIVHHGVLGPGIAFLHKPFTSEALGHKIRGVLDLPGSGSH